MAENLIIAAFGILLSAVVAAIAWLIREVLRLRVDLTSVEAQIAAINTRCVERGQADAEAKAKLFKGLDLLNEIHGWLKGLLERRGLG